MCTHCTCPVATNKKNHRSVMQAPSDQNLSAKRCDWEFANGKKEGAC